MTCIKQPTLVYSLTQAAWTGMIYYVAIVLPMDSQDVFVLTKMRPQLVNDRFAFLPAHSCGSSVGLNGGGVD